MYRLYNPNSGEHFYTASTIERDGLVTLGWKYEAVGWTAPSTSSAPVYRLYNPNAGDHFYTQSVNERDGLVALGWNYEGIGWYSETDTTMQVPVYRAYNPNAIAGAHNYTTSLTEQNWLISLGWHGEGISWYGMKRQPTIGAATIESDSGTRVEVKVLVYDPDNVGYNICLENNGQVGFPFNGNIGTSTFHDWFTVTADTPREPSATFC